MTDREERPEAVERADDTDEFIVRALERAQRVARNHGYTRSTLPSWGLDETRPRRSLDGSSEYAAIETDGLGRIGDEEGAQARAAARAAAYRHANGVEAPASFPEEDPGGDLAALRRALEGTGASWSRSPGMAAMRPRYRRANSLGAILARTISSRAWDTPTKMGSIMAKWRKIVGPQVADHARIETFEGHRLVVRTDSTAWAKQLQLLLPTIESSRKSARAWSSRSSSEAPLHPRGGRARTWCGVEDRVRTTGRTLAWRGRGTSSVSTPRICYAGACRPAVGPSRR